MEVSAHGHHGFALLLSSSGQVRWLRGATRLAVGAEGRGGGGSGPGGGDYLGPVVRSEEDNIMQSDSAVLCLRLLP